MSHIIKAQDTLQIVNYVQEYGSHSVNYVKKDMPQHNKRLNGLSQHLLVLIASMFTKTLNCFSEKQVWKRNAFILIDRSLSLVMRQQSYVTEEFSTYSS